MNFSIFFILALIALATPKTADAYELKGTLTTEGRIFLHNPLAAGQKRHNGSVALEAEFYHKWDNGSSITLTPFVRIDSADDERNHFDFREFNYLWQGDEWELLIGFDKIFWGATEFVHLVDIINQTDLVEDIDGEDKLGQPMVHFSLFKRWGVLNLFALPWFRERTFPGRNGRLRGPLVDVNNPLYESGAGKHHFDIALRYNHTLGFCDFGLYHFRGTNREPVLLPRQDPHGQLIFVPFYEQISQTGLDLQAVVGDLLLKMESIHRNSRREDFLATTAGFEYTFIAVADTPVDVGLIIEYVYDGREDDATTHYQNDIIFGLRFVFNDADGSEILAGMSQDLGSSGHLIRIEASRRLANNLKISMEITAFSDMAEGDPLYSLRRDDFIRIELIRYF